jgi:membrane protease YdiL (CAAX protease family)
VLLAARRSPLLRVLAVAAGTTALVTVLSYALPADYSGTAVGLAFVGVTYFLVLRGDDTRVRHHGLSLGGLLEWGPLDFRRMLRDGARAAGWALLAAAAIFPAFWLGFLAWWQPKSSFVLPSFHGFPTQAANELLMIALPEEAFYRGYLQTAVDDELPARRRILGANVGWSLLIVSVIFALGHLLTRLDPNRLAVFFPSLVFGWLRVRSGGIGAPTTFHALCNLFAWFLAQGYGVQA